MKRIVAGAVVAALVGVAVYGFLLTQRERSYHEWVSRGDVALARDDTYAAIEAFSVAISWKRDSMAAHLKRGEAYRRRSEYDAARRDLRTAAELDPGSPRPYELLGDVHYAMAVGEKGYAPARFARALEHYRQAIELDDSSARVQYKLGLAAYRSGQLPAALQALRDAIRLDERFVEAHYLLGVCLRAGGQLRDSMHELERAVALDRTFVAAREELAQTYAATGRTEDQLETLAALARLDPSPARARAVGIAYARAGQLDRGIAHLGGAAQANPADRETFLALGRLWLDRVARGGEIELGKALNALAEAVDTNSGSPARAIYGRALLMAGETSRAAAVLRDATRRFPVDPEAFLYLADAAERLNQPAEAREALLAYAALVLLDDLRPDALVRVAEAQLDSGNPAEARRALAAALAKDPHSSRAHALRARIE